MSSLAASQGAGYRSPSEDREEGTRRVSEEVRCRVTQAPIRQHCSQLPRARQCPGENAKLVDEKGAANPGREPQEQKGQGLSWSPRSARGTSGSSTYSDWNPSPLLNEFLHLTIHPASGSDPECSPGGTLFAVCSPCAPHSRPPLRMSFAVRGSCGDHTPHSPPRQALCAVGSVCHGLSTVLPASALLSLNPPPRPNPRAHTQSPSDCAQTKVRIYLKVLPLPTPTACRVTSA